MKKQAAPSRSDGLPRRPLGPGQHRRSGDYQRFLDASGITCSVSGRGNCHDNAAMESCFSTLKSELGEWFETHGEASEKLFDCIEVFCNQQRTHSAIGCVSPAEFERAARSRQAPQSNCLRQRITPSRSPDRHGGGLRADSPALTPHPGASRRLHPARPARHFEIVLAGSPPDEVE